MENTNESLQDIGAKKNVEFIQAKALGLPDIAAQKADIAQKAFKQYHKRGEEQEEKEASSTEKGEAKTALRSIKASFKRTPEQRAEDRKKHFQKIQNRINLEAEHKAKKEAIKEHLSNYNISEECKQSILEIFDRPSLGRTMWDLGGGKNLSAAIRGKLASWKDSLDKPDATTEYNRAHKAHQEAQAKYDRGELSPAEMATASGDLEKAKARFNKAHGFSGHTVPGAPKSNVPVSKLSQEDKPSRKEQIRSYLTNKGEYSKQKEKIDNAASDYNYKQLDYEGAKDDDGVTPSQKAVLQQKAQRAKSKFLKTRNDASSLKSEISKARKDIFPKSPKVTGRLPVYKRGEGKFKEIRESLEESFSELNALFENINTAIGGMMDAQPINLAGKEHPSYCKQKKAGYNYKFRKLHRKEV